MSSGDPRVPTPVSAGSDLGRPPTLHRARQGGGQGISEAPNCTSPALHADPLASAKASPAGHSLGPASLHRKWSPRAPAHECALRDSPLSSSRPEGPRLGKALAAGPSSCQRDSHGPSPHVSPPPSLQAVILGPATGGQKSAGGRVRTRPSPLPGWSWAGSSPLTPGSTTGQVRVWASPRPFSAGDGGSVTAPGCQLPTSWTIAP